jgi:hypothetical protein
LQLNILFILSVLCVLYPVLKNKTEVICDVPLEKIKEEIEDCKKLLEKYSSKSDTG